jgi:hypothetical protein
MKRSEKIVAVGIIVILSVLIMFSVGFRMQKDGELEARIVALEAKDSASAKESLRDRIEHVLDEESTLVVSDLEHELSMWEFRYQSQINMLSASDAQALCTFKWEIIGGLRNSGDLYDFLSTGVPNDTADENTADRDARALIARLSVSPAGPVAMNCEAALQDYLNAEPDDLVWKFAQKDIQRFIDTLDPLGEQDGFTAIGSFCLGDTLTLLTERARITGGPAAVLVNIWHRGCQ